MLRENQSAETITDLTSDEEYASCEEEDSSSGDDSDQTGGREHSSNMSTTDTSDKEEGESSTTEASDKEVETEDSWLSEDTDGSVQERCLLISSAANIRRREMQGQEYYYKENGSQVPEERKKKLTKKKTIRKENLASLEDLRKEVKRATSEDPRGLRKKNPKRAVASVEKWQTSGMWQEIVEEGNEASRDIIEAVRLLHIPHTTPMGLRDPEPPPGYKRMKFEAKTGGRIFNLLLNLSTQLFKQVSKFGKNLSSMTSEVTILAKDAEVDMEKAAIHNMKVREVNDKILIQTHAIADTGADTNCTDQILRQVLGRDKLPDAPLGLKGATGTNENKCKDKLRIISKDKEIHVIEARSIE